MRGTALALASAPTETDEEAGWSQKGRPGLLGLKFQLQFLATHALTYLVSCSEIEGYSAW
jgi:hypothetical protein